MMRFYFNIRGVKFFPAIAALLAVAFLFPSKTLGAGRKKQTPIPRPDTSDHITAVHLTSVTINVYATHTSKEYRVTPATRIIVNGRPTQLDGLATGMSVVIAPAPDGITAATIDAKTR